MTTKYKITEATWKICIAILFLFSLFIALFLAYYSTKFSFFTSDDYFVPAYLIKDNLWLNLLFFLGACAFSLLLDKLFQKLQDKERLAGYLFLGLCCVIYATVCFLWVQTLPYYPSGDQLNTTAGAYYNLNGNFIMLSKGGYIGKYPFQKGLMLTYELLFSIFGNFCYSVAAKIHIILGVIALIFGYLFVEETSWNNICKILYCPLVLFCAPYWMMTPYIYGDLPSICFCTVLFWAVLRFSRTFHIRYVVLACCMSALSLMMRVHTWIALIAIMIGMILLALQKQKLLAPLIFGVLIIACAFGAIKLIDFSYEVRSGYRGIPGSPMILHVAMGLQDNYNGPGTFNDYQTQTLETVDYDPAAASQIAREDIASRLDIFKADHFYTDWFFKTKLQLQWIDPSFEVLKSTYSFDENKPVPELISEIYFGKYHAPLNAFMNRYQTIIYLGFLCFVLSLLMHRKENAGFYIPLITIVGGFLFSIMWEAKPRYVLPYFYFMLLYVPEGLFLAGKTIRQAIKVIKRRLSFY